MVERRPCRRSKRNRRAGEDQFSALPDCLHIHILSYVNVKDAARTSVLSQRWRNLWAFTNSLLFGDSPGTLHQDNFVRFVDHSLASHRGHRLKKFQISLSKTPVSISTINGWIQRAQDKGSEELDLRFPCDGIYELPDGIVAYRSLRVLRLYNCRISLPSVKCFSALKTLSLRIHYPTLPEEWVYDNHVFRVLISNCPVLENLELIDDCILPDLDFTVSNTRLRSLKVESDFGSAPQSVHICAPLITSLELRGCLLPPGYVLGSLSSLVECSLNFIWRRKDADCGHSSAETLTTMIGKLQNVKVLILNRWCGQVLSLAELKGCQIPYLNVKYLKLEVEVGEVVSVGGIRLLLKSCRKLETLIVKAHGLITPIHSASVADDGKDQFSSEDLFPSMKHLRNIHIFQFLQSSTIIRWMRGQESDQDPTRAEEKPMKMMKFLLAKASVLERMIISTTVSQIDSFESVEALPGIEQTLRELPRASQRAEISVFISGLWQR